jgi:phage tail sheath protein FI
VSVGLELGAPGVYHAPPLRQAGLAAVRLDVAGFVGVAPRGPVDEPVVVTSWSDYQWLFGAAGETGGLGSAVHAFFAQGGVRALVLRVSPLPRCTKQEHPGRAVHRLGLGADGPQLAFEATSEGTWANSLSITWTLVVSQATRTEIGGRLVRVQPGARIPAGSLLRLWLDEGRTPVYRWVERLEDRDLGPGRRDQVLVLSTSTGVGLEPAEDREWQAVVDVDVVTAGVEVTDRSDDLRRHERFGDLGLSKDHPRWACRILSEESRLASPHGGWPDRILPPDTRLISATSVLVVEGRDRWDGIARGSFLGEELPELLPVGGVEPIDEDLELYGVERMSVVPEVGLLCVPDLLWDVVVVPATTDRPRRPVYPVFTRCRPPEQPLPYQEQPPRAVMLAGGGSSLAEALDRQQRVVALAERQRRFVALLDVPDGLHERDVARWRAAIDSSYAAAYHPWLAAVPEGGTGPGGGDLRVLSPSAVAAGIIAARERRLGIPWGPANEVAVDAVRAAKAVTDEEHARLHELDVNVFRSERDGFRLTAAHTLSKDRSLRQLTVRRLMTMLRLSLERHGQRLAFEPNTPALRRELTWSITQLLRDLYREGAFAGATEQESLFVRCDDSVNPAWSQEQGRLVAEVGVAPSYPLEFIVVRLVRDASGTVGVEG